MVRRKHIDENLLRKLYLDEKKSLKQIGVILGLSDVGVRNNLLRFGIETRSDPQSKKCHNINLLCELISQGKTYQEAANVFNVSPGHIHVWCKKHNIKTLNVWHEKKSRPSNDMLKNDYIVEKMTFCEIGKKYEVSNVTAKKWIINSGILLRTHSETIKNALPKIISSKIEKHGYAYYPPDMPFHKRSKGEKELQEFLNSKGFSFQPSRKILNGSLELDLYDEKKAFAIEYNGEIFHTDGPPNYRDRRYHRNKLDQCEAQGLRLIFINETEWKNRRKQVENYLLGSLGHHEKRVYARQCEVIKIAPNRQFLEDNHIQGPPQSIKVMYGLFYEGNLIGAITFSKHHRNVSGMTVLSRLCFLYGWQIIGGASRLFKTAVREEGFNNVLTWSDDRLSQGIVYRKMGFIEDAKLPVDYSYVKYEKVKPKQSMQKKMIGCPKNIKEADFLREQGWYRMWDCGKTRWIWQQ